MAVAALATLTACGTTQAPRRPSATVISAQNAARAAGYGAVMSLRAGHLSPASRRELQILFLPYASFQPDVAQARLIRLWPSQTAVVVPAPGGICLEFAHAATCDTYASADAGQLVILAAHLKGAVVVGLVPSAVPYVNQIIDGRPQRLTVHRNVYASEARGLGGVQAAGTLITVPPGRSAA
jgi:hypothetical protein